MDSAANWSDCLDHAVVSDVGMRRANNQDSFAIDLASDQETWTRRGHVFVVADGMGAHAAGELASKMATDGIPHTYRKRTDASPVDAIRKTVQEINTQIHRRGQASVDFQGMGTTASALLLLPQGALVAHVGDSRVYRLRGTRLEQLTFDHSLVWEMSAAGQLARDSLPTFVPKNIITRSLGPHADVNVDLEGPFPLEPGDTFLLCSDGLTGQLKDEELGAVLACHEPAEAARVLVDLANLRGGPDNITAIVVRITGQALATGASGPPEPLALETPTAAPAPPTARANLPWIVGGVLLAAAAVLAFLVPIAGLASAALGVAVLLIGLLQKLSPSADPRFLGPGSRLGRGPHTQCDCQPGAALADSLQALVADLRDAATKGNWSLDWSRFNSHSRQGEAAREKRDFPQAVREFSAALRFMMNELRNQRSRKKQDSAGDLFDG